MGPSDVYDVDVERYVVGGYKAGVAAYDCCALLVSVGWIDKTEYRRNAEAAKIDIGLLTRLGS